jgi:hypothetical protein
MLSDSPSPTLGSVGSVFSLVLLLLNENGSSPNPENTLSMSVWGGGAATKLSVFADNDTSIVLKERAKSRLVNLRFLKP